jgi:OPT family oligopeptide transporter
MFLTQVIATIISAIINYVTAVYLLNSIPNICASYNSEWKCPLATTFYSSSIIWGVIGPIRMFGSSSIYFPLLFGFLIGALLPIPTWLLLKKYPEKKWLEYIHFPVLLAGLGVLPTAPAGEYVSFFFAGFLFNFVFARYAHVWWKRYAFVLSAAMSCGVAMGVLLIFFALENNHIYFPEWWGTGGITGDGCPLANGNFSGDLPRYKSL